MKPLDTLNQTLKRILIPTPVQLIISLGLAIVIMLVAYRNLLIALVAQNSYVPESDISQVLDGYLAELSTVPLVANLSVGLFWAAVACVAYIGYIAASNILINMRNNYVIDTQFANEEGNWRYRVRSLLIKAGWAVLLLATLMLSLTSLIPLWLRWFGDPLLVGSTVPLLFVPLGLLGMAFNIYLLWMLFLAIKYSD